ncbi:MAG: hypothetical protein ACREU7_11665 [Burkholderiales bacterium]
MTTGNFQNWAGNILDIGPIYPFVGWEFILFVLGLIIWIGWHVMQMRAEDREFEEGAARLKGQGGMRKALDKHEG